MKFHGHVGNTSFEVLLAGFDESTASVERNSTSLRVKVERPKANASCVSDGLIEEITANATTTVVREHGKPPDLSRRRHPGTPNDRTGVVVDREEMVCSLVLGITVDLSRNALLTNEDALPHREEVRFGGLPSDTTDPDSHPPSCPLAGQTGGASASPGTRLSRRAPHRAIRKEKSWCMRALATREPKFCVAA